MWYGPWTTILTTLFPATDGFVVNPQLKVVDDDDDESTIPDFVIQVSKFAQPGVLNSQIVLVAEIKNSHQWPEGAERLFTQICKQANSAFSQTALRSVYWIGVIGPHWRYGRKEDDGQLKLSELIPWHDTTHDDASFDDLQTLARLVRAL